MSKFKFLSFAALTAGIITGCTEAPMSPEEIGQNQEALCANGDGVNSVMAALAVATAKELKRWSPSTDFIIDSNYRLALSATGKSQCADRKCWNTQAILDLQKAPLNSVKVAGTTFNSDNFRSRLYAEYYEQKDCEARGGTGATNCSAEAHKLTYKSQKAGACDTIFTFDAKTPTGALLKAPAQLKNKLIYVGFPQNPYLAFTSTGTTVSIDPTYGLNEGGTTTAGSCSPACTKVSAKDITNGCCSCNGATKKYKKSPFSGQVFLCQ